MNIDTNRFYTYAYTCIEQEFWNSSNEFKNIENEFFKYANVLPNNYQINTKKETLCKLENWEYAKIGVSSKGVALLSSGTNTNNYTKLPFAFANQYLYMYIWALYQKIYLNKLSKEFNELQNYEITRKKFIKFTRSSMDIRNYK